MKKKISLLMSLALAGLCGAASAAQVTLNGAGSTFIYPIASKWFDEYHKLHPDVEINYQSIGSGGGIRQVTEGTVDFGATDGPMTDEQLSKVHGTLLHIPAALGADVPTYNVEGVAGLKFTGELLADIYLGKVAKWNDAEIAKVNPAAKLPDQPITVVHRSDGSGTSFIWTDYLSKVSKDWETKVGRGTSVNWPVGLGGKGNEGVTGLVKQTPYSIGYVELIYAIQNHMDYAPVQNKAGKWIKADLPSVSAAAAGVKMPKDYRVSITNASGPKAYPISSFTWFLIPTKSMAPKGQVLHDFLTWMLNKGQAMCPQLAYAPLPASVKAMLLKTVKTVSNGSAS